MGYIGTLENQYGGGWYLENRSTAGALTPAFKLTKPTKTLMLNNAFAIDIFDLYITVKL